MDLNIMITNLINNRVEKFMEKISEKYSINFSDIQEVWNSMKILIDFIEDSSALYTSRTSINASCDATIAFFIDKNTRGEIFTKKQVEKKGKIYIPVQISENFEFDRNLISATVFLFRKNNVKSVNIAGNGIYQYKISKGDSQEIQSKLDDLIFSFISSVNDHYPIQSIKSGGQSGADESGAKAGIKLNIPTVVLSPKGWKFRDFNSKDISNEKLFKNRFL